MHPFSGSYRKMTPWEKKKENRSRKRRSRRPGQRGSNNLEAKGISMMMEKADARMTAGLSSQNALEEMSPRK